MRVLVTAAAALAGGWLGQLAGLPVAWLVGSALAVILANLASGRPWRVPRNVHRLATVVIGVTIGATFSPDVARAVAGYLLPAAAVVAATVALSLAHGSLVARWAGIDRVTALIGAIPGGAGGMVLMSGEIGADDRFVIALQYLRLAIVITLVPLLAVRLLGEGTAALPAGTVAGTVAAASPALAGLQAVLAVAPLAAAGAWLGVRSGVPGGAFVGPIVATAAARWLGLPALTLPAALVDGALLLLGASVGSRFDLRTLVRVGRAALVNVLLVGALIAACAGLGYGLHVVTDLDVLTAVLATTPGGMDVMTVTALGMGADVSVVVAVQVMRFFVMVLLVPGLVRRLVGGTGADGAEGQAPPAGVR